MVSPPAAGAPLPLGTGPVAGGVLLPQPLQAKRDRAASTRAWRIIDPRRYRQAAARARVPPRGRRPRRRRHHELDAGGHAHVNVERSASSRSTMVSFEESPAGWGGHKLRLTDDQPWRRVYVG